MRDTILDFHTHPYLSEAEFLNHYPECFSPSPQQLRQDLEWAGIHRICGSVILKEAAAAGFSGIHQANLRALALKEILGDFYIPGFHVHPDYVEESIAEIEWMQEKGIRLIGELVPYLHGWHGYSGRNLSRILDAAGHYKMVVSFHTDPADLAGYSEIAAMVRSHPDVTFVAAHPNERAMFREHLKCMEACPNFYLDLSGAGIFRYGAIAYGVRQVGSERLLFGTDYPICNPRMYVQAVYQEPLSEEDRENILHRNAERILGIEG